MPEKNMQFNILLVESNTEDLALLTSLIENIFTQDYKFFSLKITTAQTGHEALISSAIEEQDMIISSLEVPVVTGIELIQKIRMENASVPVLVLSTDKAETYIDEVLEHGASNYSVKPLNHKLFTAQVKLFIDLYLRRQKIYNYKAVNLFSKNVYRRKTEFLIEEENDIVEFWEFILESFFSKYKVEKVLHFIYDIEIMMIKNGHANSIILEEDNKNFYLTLPEMNKLTQDAIDTMIVKKNIDIAHYKSNGYFISLVIVKDSDDVKSIAHSDIKQAIFEDIRRSLHENISVEEFLAQLDVNYKSELETIFDSLTKLSVLIYKLETTSLEESISIMHGIVHYMRVLDKITHTIGLSDTLHRSFENLTSFLETLDVLILQNIEKRLLLSQMLQGLIYDLKSWARILFVDKTANNVNYFDASFAENCFAIESTFKTFQEDEDDSLLEFFDDEVLPTKASTDTKRLKDLRFTQLNKMSAVELLESLDDIIIDKVESLNEELDSLIELIYKFEESEPVFSLALIPEMQEVVSDIFQIVDSMGFFQVTARAFESLNDFLARLTLDDLSNPDNKAMFVLMFLSLIQDLEKWLEVIFIDTSSDDIHYFDASFSSNIMEIEAVFEVQDDSDDDLEFF